MIIHFIFIFFIIVIFWSFTFLAAKHPYKVCLS